MDLNSPEFIFYKFIAILNYICWGTPVLFVRLKFQSTLKNSSLVMRFSNSFCTFSILVSYYINIAFILYKWRHCPLNFFYRTEKSSLPNFCVKSHIPLHSTLYFCICSIVIFRPKILLYFILKRNCNQQLSQIL